MNKTSQPNCGFTSWNPTTFNQRSFRTLYDTAFAVDKKRVLSLKSRILKFSFEITCHNNACVSLLSHVFLSNIQRRYMRHPPLLAVQTRGATHSLDTDPWGMFVTDSDRHGDITEENINKRWHITNITAKHTRIGMGHYIQDNDQPACARLSM